MLLNLRTHDPLRHLTFVQIAFAACQMILIAAMGKIKLIQYTVLYFCMTKLEIKHIWILRKMLQKTGQLAFLIGVRIAYADLRMIGTAEHHPYSHSTWKRTTTFIKLLMIPNTKHTCKIF